LTQVSDHARQQLDDGLPKRSDNVTLADGGAAITVDPAEKKKLVHDMLIAPPTPQPTPDAMALLSIPPNTITIDVENGSGVRGAAHVVAAELKAKGFAIGHVGNAPGDVEATEIHEHSQTAFAAAKVRAALPAALHALAVVGDDPSATASSDVTLIVGKDLIAALNAPTTPGSALPTPTP